MSDDRLERLISEALEADTASIQSALAIVAEIETTKEHLQELERQLSEMGESLLGAVSLELRKLLPKVTAELSRNGCTFKYKARSIVVIPDFKNNMWVIKPGGNSSRDRAFASGLGEGTKLPLTAYKEAVQAIAKLFVGKYVTLQGGSVPTPTPEEDEIPDTAIDDALANAPTPEGPKPPGGRRIEIKGVSRTPGGANYV